MTITKKYLSLLACGTACLLSLSAQAHEAGDWFVRAGVASVAPSETSSIIRPTIVSPAGEVSIDNDTQLGLTGTYMFSDNWAVEVLAATPFTHTINFAGDLAGLGSLATAKHLPPTVSAQYFFDTSGKFMPYVGIGLNYTYMMSKKATANGIAVLDSVGTGGNYNIEADHSVGLTGQIGFDYQLSDKYFFNAAVWYMDIDTTIEVANALEVDLNIEPWVVMIGITYKF